ncbi:Tetratricopeptide repeat protein 17 [Lamellibrachia satsuma]|nr:Tetratricopeptide repeat protein 17 [Lamellibrachia satsuma]
MCSNVFFQVIPVIKGTTHWVVTEDGRIQAQLDSVFNLQRPYDLVALLKQEDRAHMLENLKQELLAKKDQIDSSEDKNTGGCCKTRLYLCSDHL